MEDELRGQIEALVLVCAGTCILAGKGNPAFLTAVTKIVKEPSEKFPFEDEPLRSEEFVAGFKSLIENFTKRLTALDPNTMN